MAIVLATALKWMGYKFPSVSPMDVAFCETEPHFENREYIKGSHYDIEGMFCKADHDEAKPGDKIHLTKTN